MARVGRPRRSVAACAAAACALALATVDAKRKARVGLPASVRPGTHTVTIAFSGTAIQLPGTTTQVIEVGRVGATVRTTASGVRFRGPATVHVTASAKLPPSGKVVAWVGNYKVGSATLRHSHGRWVATIHTRSIRGTGTLTVRYGGNHGVAPKVHKVAKVKRSR